MAESIIVIQARTSSSRLPAKVLLPVGGCPLVVLAARRAASTGRHVIVATSSEASDDFLADLLVREGIHCYRGSLKDPLARFVGALETHSDDTLVFRLTADNVFPDGALLDELEESFFEGNLNYICCNGHQSGLPYGVSAELTRLGCLREANFMAVDALDREHVTPFIRRKYGESYFERYRHLEYGHYRCTVDCFADYLAVQHVFNRVASPETESLHVLIELLKDAPYQPISSSPTEKLVLGTAQLGLPYGVTNLCGKPDALSADLLVKSAIVNGVRYVDTARAYGDSEKVIGDALGAGWQGRAKVVTKLSPLSQCSKESTSAEVSALVDASIFQSLAALRMRELDVLMLHRASHLFGWSGAAFKRLLEHREAGTVKALGVSVQNPTELSDVLEIPELEYIQMPFNVLDWRWDRLVRQISEQKKCRALIIHVRSVLLQGLLLSSRKSLWRLANVAEPAPVIDWLETQASNMNCKSIAHFCLRYAKSLDWVDGVVVGMESMDQLLDNIEAFSVGDMQDSCIHQVEKSRPIIGEMALNPSFWRHG